jgi:hypothetical protein
MKSTGVLFLAGKVKKKQQQQRGLKTLHLVRGKVFEGSGNFLGVLS